MEEDYHILIASLVVAAVILLMFLSPSTSCTTYSAGLPAGVFFCPGRWSPLVDIDRLVLGSSVVRPIGGYPSSDSVQARKRLCKLPTVAEQRQNRPAKLMGYAAFFSR
jgi:hypothetical protein